MSVVESIDPRHLLLQRISDLIAEARRLGIDETAFILKMAHLDLQTKIFDIDDNELTSFIGAIRARLEGQES